METKPSSPSISDDDAELHARRVEIGDGRYLIFFTFGDESAEDEAKEVRDNV